MEKIAIPKLKIVVAKPMEYKALEEQQWRNLKIKYEYLKRLSNP
jgi:hypothetical protein